MCCGGVKRLDGMACEIKRMFVAPEARGRGAARILLEALEDRARELGYVTARLDTGPRQPHARALYESAGYERDRQLQRQSGGEFLRRAAALAGACAASYDRGVRFRLGIDGLLCDLGCSMTSVTPYGLCDYRCAYCVTGVQGASRPVATADHAVKLLRKHLAEAESPPILLLGALSDAYPTAEAEFGVTRAIVSELVAAGVPFAITTKSTIILRDLDLLVAHGERAYVQISICSVDDEVLRSIDPGAPSGVERFAVIDELRRARVRVGLNLLPWIPDVSDTAAIVKRVADDVEVVVGPLSFGIDNDRRRLLGRTFTRDEVWRRYWAEYERFGHIANTSWVAPSMPPEENNPIHRLPRRRRPGETPPGTDGWADEWRTSAPEWAAPARAAVPAAAHPGG